MLVGIIAVVLGAVIVVLVIRRRRRIAEGLPVFHLLKRGHDSRFY